MHITIADRFKPYSHTPGAFFVLPKTTLRFQIFPSLLIVDDLANLQKSSQQLTLDIKGPVKDFTAMLDLEKLRLTVWGHASNGFFRYHVVACETNGFEMIWGKKALSSCHHTEILSLGNNKAQNLDLIRNRCDLTEILPLWYKLGQVVPQPSQLTKQGTAFLLNECRNVAAFKNVYLAAFDAGFSPRLEDSQHQGFDLPANDGSGSAIQILTEGFKQIREMFIQEHEGSLAILPALPPEFHCGRLKNLRTKFGIIDIEWSKKTIRRMVIKSDVTGILSLHLQSDVERFRTRCNENEKGIFYTRGAPIPLEAGQTYLLDRFEK